MILRRVQFFYPRGCQTGLSDFKSGFGGLRRCASGNQRHKTMNHWNHWVGKGAQRLLAKKP
jgi:hypothetical protein